MEKRKRKIEQVSVEESGEKFQITMTTIDEMNNVEVLKIVDEIENAISDKEKQVADMVEDIELLKKRLTPFKAHVAKARNALENLNTAKAELDASRKKEAEIKLQEATEAIEVSA